MDLETWVAVNMYGFDCGRKGNLFGGQAVTKSKMVVRISSRIERRQHIMMRLQKR